MTADRPLFGIALMLGFCLLAPFGDGLAKYLGAAIPLLQLVALRFAVQAALLLPMMATGGRRFAMTRRVLWLTVLRTLLHIAGIGTMFLSLQYLPLADAIAIAFVMPFVLLLLGWLFLGESVGARRIAACAVGFGGALLVIQPSIQVFGLVALWPLGTAFFFAFYMLVTRAISAYMHPVAMQFHTSWIGLALCLPVMVLADGSGFAPLDPVMPQGLMWLWLLGVGFWAAISHMSMTYALKFAPSATLAPLHYSEIVVAVALGYLIFGDFPNLLTWAGIAIITSSGLYIIYRERITARQMAGQMARQPTP